MRQSLFLAFLALFSCSAAVAQSTDHSANGLELQRTFTPGRAMELIYGSYDYSKKASRWTLENPAQSYSRYWPKTIDVQFLLAAPFVESGTPKYLLVTSGMPKEKDPGEFSCHSCGVLIGLAILARSPDGWRVEASDLQFGNYGAFGQPPPFSLQPIGTDRYGLMMTTSFGSTGEWEKSVTMIIPMKGKFVKALSAQIEGSGDWNCSRNVAEEQKNDCVAYDGDVEMLPSSGSQYFDLLVTKRVYRSFSKQQPIGTTPTRYRFAGSKYIPEK